jgi:hypothetical protein
VSEVRLPADPHSTYILRLMTDGFVMTRTSRFCDYSDSSQPGQTDEISDLQRRIRELEERVLQTPNTSSIAEVSSLLSPELSVQASYLDSELWSSCNLPVPTNDSLVPDEIAAVLGNQLDIDDVKFHYFSSVHTWMPIISKMRLNRVTEQTPRSIKADVALLLLCMKLVQEIPHPQRTGFSELYATAKRFSKELEIKGLLTLRTVQAELLLSVYELGHGIFPAAFTTIGHCARNGVALGLHNRLAPQLAGKRRSWVDWEERQRVWWMVVILDRCEGRLSYHCTCG